MLFGTFLTVLGLAVGTLVFLGCISQKYELEKWDRKQAQNG